jgi:signal transduction histidine kinase/predicted RNA-binding protein with RPS1 domain/DNA-binding response OmpR family regulator
MGDHAESISSFRFGNLLFSVGQAVTGAVTKADADTITVELPGKVRGIIRRASLPPELRQQRCDEVISRDAEIEAVIEEIDAYKHIVYLSQLKIVRDPWNEARSRLGIGSEVSGEVRDIQPYGAFVDLEGGISGLIHFTEIPGAQRDRVEDVLAIGDLVEARITSVDDSKRQLGLSIQRQVDILRNHRKKAGENAEQEAQADAELLRRAAAKREPSLFRLQGGKGCIKCILLVDDDTHFLTQHCLWLTKEGYQVETSGRGLDGVERAIAEGPDLVLMDANLPDISGVEAIRQIKAARPAVLVALVTGNSDMALADGLEESEVIEVISKYQGPGAIESLIARLEAGTSQSTSQKGVKDVGREAELLDKHDAGKQWSESLHETLGRMLATLLKDTRAQAGAVFMMHPGTSDISVVATSGALSQGDFDDSSLRYSPVRDVIRASGQLFEGRALDRGKKYQYLLRSLMFESCIGLPIELGRKQGTGYALFLFHRNADQFTNAHLLQASLASRTIGLAIERREMYEHEQEMQSLAVSGLLQAGLLHEINNQLGDIELSMRNVRADYSDLRQEPVDRASDIGFLDDMGESIDTSLKAAERVRQVAESYLGLLGNQQRQKLNVNELLVQAKAVVDIEAHDKVLVKVKPAKTLPLTHGVASRLQRGFVNVMLNAVQQIKAHSDGTGTVLVATFLDAKSTTHPIKIRFIDTGPGIHRRDFERIFERGVSGRKGGSGLGLFITRGLIESMGGQIRVEDSRLFVGTCFLIELPAVADKEVARERAGA